jgi:hypothetical protein
MENQQPNLQRPNSSKINKFRDKVKDFAEEFDLK